MILEAEYHLFYWDGMKNLYIFVILLCCGFGTMFAASESKEEVYDMHGRSELFWSIVKGDLETFEECLAGNGIDVNAPWKTGSVAIKVANKELPSCERGLCLYADDPAYKGAVAEKMVASLYAAGCTFERLKPRKRVVRCALDPKESQGRLQSLVRKQGKQFLYKTSFRNFGNILYTYQTVPDEGYERIAKIVKDLKEKGDSHEKEVSAVIGD